MKEKSRRRNIETSEERLMEQFKEIVDRVRFRMAAYG